MWHIFFFFNTKHPEDVTYTKQTQNILYVWHALYKYKTSLVSDTHYTDTKHQECMTTSKQVHVHPKYHEKAYVKISILAQQILS